MANLTRDEVANRALEALGVKAAGQDSSAEDLNRAGESVDGIYNMLRKEQLAPFAVSAVPEWAQSALIHLSALDLVATFGTTASRLETIRTLASKGRSDLATQVASTRAPIPIRAEYF